MTPMTHCVIIGVEAAIPKFTRFINTALFRRRGNGKEKIPMTTKIDAPEMEKVTAKPAAEVKKTAAEPKKVVEKTAADVKKAVAEVEPMEKVETTAKKAKVAVKKTTKKAMAEGEKAQEEVVAGVKKYAKYVTEPAHQVYLVSLGAVALAQEEFIDLYHKLADEGASFNKDGMKILHRAEKAGKDEVADVQGKVEDKWAAATETVETTVEKVLARLNVPTKADIERLSKKIAELSEKVDDLKRTNGYKG